MKLKFFIALCILLISSNIMLHSQPVQRPKLVVGIVIDQMRFDYLYRFKSYYGKNGFDKLMNSGTNFTFAHFNYVPTFTAPGHSSIYTGTTPFYHGMIANDWYDKSAKKMIYCVSDSTEESIGSSDKEGAMSPKRLLATTITDQLKLASHGASKVISISLKDRAAILPGGHMADAAYWYDNKTGDFISSSYYLKSLPKWVDDFNSRKLADKYLSGGWKLFRSASDYQISSPDESPYESDVFSEGKTSFPHSFQNVKADSKYEILETTPFGNQIVENFVKTALVNENMGKGKDTDFLAVSFSSTDYVGHAYGTNSFELEDTYLRLDEQIADLMQALDDQVGKDNYVLFLTADHGALITPGYLKEQRLPTGELNSKKALDSLSAVSKRTFGNLNLIENFSNGQIFLNHDLIKENNLDIHQVVRVFADYIGESLPGVSAVFTRDDLARQTASRDNSNLVLNGFNAKLSGDIVIVLKPGYLINNLAFGTTHGVQYAYDTHVPMLFYGWHIPAQTINTPVYIVDIAPTIADLLKITEPDGCMGIPLIK
jgi:predicted AlkP superfamily pyrophosphatase or phosphodiesterase